MLRKTIFSPENYYHIFNRGIEKRDIFLNENDYFRFLILLYLCNNSDAVDIRNLFNKGLSFVEILNIERKNLLVDIGAYCLMRNHIHLLLKERKENGISVFTKKIFTGYSMYFNKKNQRSGRLFENTFKAELIDSDNYLKYLFAYIHLNPVKFTEPEWKIYGIKNLKKAKSFLENYPWSSYHAYNKNQNDPILNKEEFPKYFKNLKEFNDFINDWLNFQPQQSNKG
ncbi:MAG: transposase [Candidatus Terrybacteria bacterium]|nr:transposase [Candidatus Terrybacteria bacterium]